MAVLTPKYWTAFLIIAIFTLVLSQPGNAFVLGKNECSSDKSTNTGRPFPKLNRRWQATATEKLGVPSVIPAKRRAHGLALRPTSLKEDIAPATSTPPLLDPEAGPRSLTSQQDDEREKRESKLGLLVLFTVPMVWGTYVPVVRTMYEIDPPVPGFVFSACYFAVASLSTLALVAMKSGDNGNDGKEALAVESSTEISKEDTSTGLPKSILAGMELGTYLFLGNSLQVLGLKTVPSDRAGFLVQLTTILVPLVEATLGGNLLAVDIRTWGACFLALAGITVMGVDHSAVTDVSSILAGFHALGSGDLLIMGAALMYTMHVVRLGKYARQTTPLNLAASKATVELILSIGLLAGLIAIASTGGSLDDAMVGAGSGGGLVAYARESGREIQTFYETFRQGIESGTLPASTLQKIVGATLWTGWVSTAYTIYAQSFGQRRVSPTDANLIYSVQPIFTAIFAFFLLGETMEPVAFVGGGLIGAAVYLVASKSVSA